MNAACKATAPPLDLLRCPVTGDTLRRVGDHLVGTSGRGPRYSITPEGIPLFAEAFISEEARAQQRHYDRVASAYVANLGYPHTQEYVRYLDEAYEAVLPSGSLGVTAELCCGHSEAARLLGGRYERLVGVDISLQMLSVARDEHEDPCVHFCQGDATRLPLASRMFDTVVMLGGIHHVPNRPALFAEVARILKPGGAFYFREPLDDFPVWRAIRRMVYRFSPALDADTERPLRRAETVPLLSNAGLRTDRWDGKGFLGFCLFMNSDILVFNRLFRFVPGIRALTRAFVALDERMLRIPGLGRWGLQVVARAVKTAR